MATTAGEVNTAFGFMNFALNNNGERYADAPEYTWTHTGAGSNLIYIDPENELVIVCRWIQGRVFADVVHEVLRAMDAGTEEGR